MISTADNGKSFVVKWTPRRGARAGCGCVVVGMASFTALIFAMALLPPRQVTLDCSRARGSCTERARTIPLGNVQRASLERGHRGGSRGYYVSTADFVLLLSSGEHDTMCTAPADDPRAAELKAAVERANAFFGSTSAETLRVICGEEVDTTGERIYYPISTSFLLVLAILALRLFPAQRVVIDSRARAVRVRSAFGSGGKKREIPFADVEEVVLDGAGLRLRVRSGDPLLIASPANEREGQALAKAKSRIESLLASRA